MIPAFPEFIPLALDQKEEIEKITDDFSPYSDFNFVSLWCWNLTNKTELSLLNSNLVVRMEDYITAEIFYMFIGKYKIEQTIEELLTFFKKENLPEELYLLPEEMLAPLLPTLKKKYKVTEDRDNFDYIISVDDLAKLKGRPLHQKRKLVNKFLKDKNPQLEITKLNDKEIKKKVLSFFEIWKKSKGDYDSKNEWIAINKLYDGLEDLPNIYVLVATLDNETIGFSVFEILENEYAIGDFQKGNIKYKGIYEYLNFSLAKFLNSNNVIFYNIEQDLGIAGLRRAKLDYNPKFLRKYTLKVI